jgi:UDP-N-acetylglucosamine--N-acetylmuramyl-(pentapeptide) pyrophosphoryl-undecaprenol N-acetylglucosamine transferase
VYPALAIVEELSPSAEVLWVGGEEGMERALVPRADIPLKAIPAAGVHGVGLRALPGNLWRLARGALEARGLIRAFRPDALLFTGGYVGIPVALAGWRLPRLVFVPDIEPGLAAKVICRGADRVGVTAEAAKAYFPRAAQVVVTGYPVRRQLRDVNRSSARESLGLISGPPVLLVLGGSRGARSINQALWTNLQEVLDLAQVLHITGELDWGRASRMKEGLTGASMHDYHPHSYLHEDMGAALAAADLALSRAGASVLGEYPLFGLPSILVPYPYAWRYQRVNARHMVSRGAAVEVQDEDLQRDLVPVLRDVLADPARLSSMSRAARELARPDAARALARLLEDLAGKDGGTRG